jgi:broad specificity phosphatase PhoE
MIQFEETMTENDTMWKPDQRETWQSIEQRIQSFLQWLVSTTSSSSSSLPTQQHTTNQRNCKNIIVVSHGVWIEVLFRMCAPNYLGDRRVYNLDAFACQCISRNGQFIRLGSIEQIDG